MPKPVYKDLEEDRHKIRPLSKNRHKWVCPSCNRVHWDFRKDMCRNQNCRLFKVEGILSADDPKRNRPRARKK